MAGEQRFRNKYVEIEALQFTGDNAEKVADFCHGQVGSVGPIGGAISTLWGRREFTIGDWIIKGVEGGLGVCSPAIFSQKYEPAVAPDTLPPDLLRAALWTLVWWCTEITSEEHEHAWDEAFRILGLDGELSPTMLTRAREALRMLPEEADAGE